MTSHSEKTHLIPPALWTRLVHFNFAPATFPLAAIILLGLCFGPFVGQMGFFWDDWVQLLSKHLYGFPAYMRYFYERPLSGWTHIVFGPLMADDPLRWQLFSLLLRAGCVVAAWALFQWVWPRARRFAALAALLFAVYPGFTQQAISVAYHQHWLQYLLFLLSLVWMVLALRRPRHRWIFTAAAVICQALQFSITEFFVGVDLLRPVLLWIVLSSIELEEKKSSNWRWLALKTLRAWLPYLAVTVVYVVWRLFFMPLPEGHQNTPALLAQFRAQPLDALLRLARCVLIDTLNVLIAVWEKVFDLRLANSGQPVIIFSWAASLAAALGAAFYLSRLRPVAGELEQTPARTGLEWMVVGLLGVLVANAPLWMTGQNILWAVEEDVYHSDRFTLAAMLWASLLLAGLISWIVDRWKARVLILAVVVGLLVGFQIRNANDYRWLSQDQSNFYWQLSWRAPAIQPGTALISEEILFPYQGMFATASAVNLLYPQPANPEKVAYWAYALKPRFENEAVQIQTVSFNTRVRLYTFEGQVPNTLLLLYGAPKSNCLWLLRPQDVDHPDLSPLVKKWLPFSNLERVSPQAQNPALPSETLFGPQPALDWCYYFEKADLARQTADWQTAAALGDAAQSRGYSPQKSGSNSAYEWMPFIEAYAHQGRWQDAANLVASSLNFDRAYAPFVCGRWRALLAALPDGGGRIAADQALMEQGACTP